MWSIIILWILLCFLFLVCSWRIQFNVRSRRKLRFYMHWVYIVWIVKFITWIFFPFTYGKIRIFIIHKKMLLIISRIPPIILKVDIYRSPFFVLIIIVWICNFLRIFKINILCKLFRRNILIYLWLYRYLFRAFPLSFLFIGYFIIS